jgi:putative peptide zinc metalloprotease protein
MPTVLLAQPGGDMTAEPDSAVLRRWCPAQGVVFLGPVEGSGLKNSAYLLKRADGQVLQVSGLLHLVMNALSPEKSADEVAQEVSNAYGRKLGVDGLLHLVDTRLAPMGLVEEAADGESGANALPRPGALPTSNPLLILRLRGTLLPERAVNMLAAFLAPLYRGPVVVGVLAVLAIVDVLMLLTGDFMASLEQVLLTPALLLGIVALMTLGAVIHELGHAAACRYGGAKPGVIGVGVYLVFPAFFTNVTDSYRLGRAGRIRTDLGGLYFNCLCLIALGGAYLLTGQGFFLLAAALMHLEMVQQLVPTLRFDGYFVLADIAGVPDLFNRIRPVLLSLLPGRPVDPRVAELRPFARRIVTAWVVTVVPLLFVTLGWMLLNLPMIIGQTAAAIMQHATFAGNAITAGDAPAAVLSMFSILMLSLPVIGLGILLYRLLSALLVLLARLGRRAGRKAAKPPAAAQSSRPEPSQKVESAMAIEVPSAATRDAVPTLQDFLAERPTPPSVLAEAGWQGALRRFTGNAINPAPGRQERIHLQAVDDVQRHLDGPRTVVVVNPKGGAHKTTATLLLAATMGTMRGGYTLAWDNNETRGTLGWRAPRAGHPRTAVDLLEEVDRFENPVLGRIGDLDRYVRYQGSTQFDVLASDEDAAGAATIGSREFDRLHTALRRFYRIILVDTGNNMRSSNWEAAVAAADELVIISTLREDTVASAVWLIDGLRERGFEAKVSNSVTLLAAPSRETDTQLHRRTRSHFASLTREVLDVPYDPSLVSGARLNYQALHPATREAWLHASAAVMRGL